MYSFICQLPGQGILVALKGKGEERTSEGGGLSWKCLQMAIGVEQGTIASLGPGLHRGSLGKLMKARKCLLCAATPFTAVFTTTLRDAGVIHSFHQHILSPYHEPDAVCTHKNIKVWRG